MGFELQQKPSAHMCKPAGFGCLQCQHKWHFIFFFPSPLGWALDIVSLIKPMFLACVFFFNEDTSTYQNKESIWSSGRWKVRSCPMPRLSYNSLILALINLTLRVEVLNSLSSYFVGNTSELWSEFAVAVTYFDLAALQAITISSEFPVSMHAFWNQPLTMKTTI